MENLIEITSVPVIVAIVYAALAIYKHFVKAEKWVRLIPLWAALHFRRSSTMWSTL